MGLNLVGKSKFIPLGFPYPELTLLTQKNSRGCTFQRNHNHQASFQPNRKLTNSSVLAMSLNKRAVTNNKRRGNATKIRWHCLCIT